ncbi:hypothetical protein [Haloarcula nitratireducens]|uniref:Uncharacterized protein n=1 Tax=Haloarcula nitratireducens TaxID=2487749 RepID=A0AAW4PDF3_9EURY|nr:hypothetical protein [Halomicroarcula nitratireducens]MBX0295951.1 hypothetical protein [Halomicroarcula nitratireducens]
MPTRPTGVVSPRPPPATESGIESERVTPHRPSTVASQSHLLLLRCQIAALEMELEREQQRRQEIIDRYERLLAER